MDTKWLYEHHALHVSAAVGIFLRKVKAKAQA